MAEGSELVPERPLRNRGAESNAAPEHPGARAATSARARAASGDERWLALLAEAGTALASSLECDTIIENLLRLAVPTAGDWCIVHLIEDDRIARVVTAHVDPAKDAVAQELARRYPLDMGNPISVLMPLHTGRTELMPEVTDRYLREQTRNADELRLLRALSPTSRIAVPLIARGTLVGVVNVFITESDRRYGPVDVERIEKLAILAALAIDNSLLYRTARREIAERSRAEEALGQSLSLLRATIESTTDGLLVVDRAGKITSYNRRFVDMWHIPENVLAGREDEEVIGTIVDQLRNPVAFLERVTALYNEPDAESFDILEFNDGRVFERYSRPQRINGEFVGRVWSFRDTTDRVHVERRQRLMAEASSLLASSLDYRETLQGVAELLVPAFADWCQVDVLEDDGYIHQVAAARASPVDAADEHALRVPAPTLEGVLARVMRTGEPLLISEVSDAFLRHIDAGDERGRRLKAAGPRSLLVVPLAARQRTIGVCTLAITTGTARRFSAVELRIMQELAHRAALAIDNARLYESALLANRTKSDFLAVMSHELRTPLTAIMGYAELLADEITGPVSPRQKGQLERILGSAQHLLELIEEILSFARIEAGRETVRLAPVDARLLVQEVAILIEPSATKKRLRLEVRPPPRHTTIQSDPGKVRQILINLLSNAIKFTEHGEVGVSGRLEEDRMVFAVWDTGIGIAPHHLDHIFDPFWQVEQPSTRHIGGTGLGLSVTRHLARLLGGDVSIDSRPGQGSTFTVWLPSGREEVSQ
jgi:PAS domain S-box-containing protein